MGNRQNRALDTSPRGPKKKIPKVHRPTAMKEDEIFDMYIKKIEEDFNTN